MKWPVGNSFCQEDQDQKSWEEYLMPGAFDEHDPAEIPECVVEDSYIKISKGKLIKKILFNHYSQPLAGLTLHRWIPVVNSPTFATWATNVEVEVESFDDEDSDEVEEEARCRA